MKRILLVVFFLFFFIGCNQMQDEEYQINFDLNGGTYNNMINTIMLKYEEGMAMPIPEKEGYIFLGWAENGVLISTVEKKNYTLTAMWEEATYTITYNLVGGVCENLITSFKYNEEVELPIPTRNGYTFVGWYENEELIEEIGNEDYVLTAKWQKDYMVRLYVDSSLFSRIEIKAQDVVRISELELVSDKLDTTRFNYNIIAAYTDSELTKEIALDTVISEDIKLYVKILGTPKISSYEGLTVSIVGDSISTFYQEGSEVNSFYSGENQFYYPIYSSTVKSYTKTWWWLSITGTNTKLGVNNSWSGSTCYNYGNQNGSGAMNMNRLNTLDDNGTPDIVIVNIGTNDLVSGLDYTTFQTAYNTMLTRIRTLYPNAYILCYNLGSNNYTSDKYNEGTRLVYNEVIALQCRLHSAALIDLASVQTDATKDVYLGDRLHPSAEGMVAMSEVTIKAIQKLFSEGIEFHL